jgi:hypothetical protein
MHTLKTVHKLYLDMSDFLKKCLKTFMTFWDFHWDRFSLCSSCWPWNCNPPVLVSCARITSMSYNTQESFCDIYRQKTNILIIFSWGQYFIIHNCKLCCIWSSIDYFVYHKFGAFVAKEFIIAILIQIFKQVNVTWQQ